MFSLYQRPVSRYGGYRLNLSFDRVLRVLALLEEPELDDADKVDLALRLLVMNKRKLLRLNPVQKMELYEGILRDCIADQSASCGKPGTKMLRLCTGCGRDL